ncbi:hypothetical protein B0H10DRAFT_2266132 [Mycena sp. CBHHK59/15]|nr:hypothetical protein B0H10DRAFT_2266132 [Mycena sp. CBHHK59/15]
MDLLCSAPREIGLFLDQAEHIVWDAKANSALSAQRRSLCFSSPRITRILVKEGYPPRATPARAALPAIRGLAAMNAHFGIAMHPTTPPPPAAPTARTDNVMQRGLDATCILHAGLQAVTARTNTAVCLGLLERMHAHHQSHKRRRGRGAEAGAGWAPCPDGVASGGGPASLPIFSASGGGWATSMQIGEPPRHLFPAARGVPQRASAWWAWGWRAMCRARGWGTSTHAPIGALVGGADNGSPPSGSARALRLRARLSAGAHSLHLPARLAPHTAVFSVFQCIWASCVPSARGAPVAWTRSSRSCGTGTWVQAIGLPAARALVRAGARLLVARGSSPLHARAGGMVPESPVRHPGAHPTAVETEAQRAECLTALEQAVAPSGRTSVPVSSLFLVLPQRQRRQADAPPAGPRHRVVFHVSALGHTHIPAHVVSPWRGFCSAPVPHPLSNRARVERLLGSLRRDGAAQHAEVLLRALGR